MKFILLVVFLFFCSQLAWAAPRCPQGEDMSTIVSAMKQFPNQYKVNHNGAYVDSAFWGLRLKPQK